jgi:hypothetical protein
VFVYLFTFHWDIKGDFCVPEKAADIHSTTLVMQRARVIERINERTAAAVVVIHSFCRSKLFLKVRHFSVCLTR